MQQLSPGTERLARRVEGVLRCSRYAFGPNRLHYCGPDQNREIFSYIKEGAEDFGLELLMRQFHTMFPYLRYIARSNGIQDPFDTRVVEAYWIGNGLLSHIEKKAFWRHLMEEQALKAKIGATAMDRVGKKIVRGALPHHSFHVLNIWKRTGHNNVPHTLESMDACRVSPAIVREIDGPNLTVEIEPLLILDRKVILGDAIRKRISRNLDSEIDDIRIGDTISIHWDVPCEVLTPREVKNLRYYTAQSIALANQTL